MSTRASLTAGLVKKGRAQPAANNADTRTPATPKGKAAADDAPPYYKALTVKLNRKRYEDIKRLGVKLDKKSQEIFTEALDLWIAQEDS